jgi:mRNA-degrading endonuclease toxin of MazEF toxin-antitoxin module
VNHGGQLFPGSVWFVSSYLLSGGDVKDERPVVIVQGPRAGVTIVVVWARTTDATVKGILTPAGVVDGLNKPGVFAPRHQHFMEVSGLREPACRYLGQLPEPFLSAVLSLWESL